MKKKNRIAITLEVEEGISMKMILSSLSSMVGVTQVNVHRLNRTWVNGYMEEKKK